MAVNNRCKSFLVAFAILCAVSVPLMGADVWGFMDSGGPVYGLCKSYTQKNLKKMKCKKTGGDNYLCGASQLSLMPFSTETKCNEYRAASNKSLEAAAERKASPVCKALYKEADDLIKRSNYCIVDSDCSLLRLGGHYIEFGCYHFVNKAVDQKSIYQAIEKHAAACSNIVDDCSWVDASRCVDGKCVERK